MRSIPTSELVVRAAQPQIQKGHQTNVDQFIVHLVLSSTAVSLASSDLFIECNILSERYQEGPSRRRPSKPVPQVFESVPSAAPGLVPVYKSEPPKSIMLKVCWVILPSPPSDDIVDFGQSSSLGRPPNSHPPQSRRARRWSRKEERCSSCRCDISVGWGEEKEQESVRKLMQEEFPGCVRVHGAPGERNSSMNEFG